MARFLRHDHHPTYRRTYRLILAFFWLLGLLSGGYLFHRADDSFVSMMCSAVDRRVSIVGLASVIFLPFLFSAFAVYLRHPRLLWLVAFGKALCFSYTALAVLSGYGCAAWLALPLLMFSDIGSIPLLWLFWLGSREGSDAPTGRTIRLFFAAGCIGCVDYFIVSPFLCGL